MDIGRLIVGIVMVLFGAAGMVFRAPVGRWYSVAIRTFVGRKDAAPGARSMAVLVFIVAALFTAFGVVHIFAALGRPA